MSGTLQYLRIGIGLVALLAAFTMFAEDEAPAGIPVAEYCERFAREYARESQVNYVEGSVQVHKKLGIGRIISNLFQPRDSRFVAGYDCHFQASGRNEFLQAYKVNIFLTGTRDFAEHTHWESLQVIPIAYVTDPASSQGGYGVFKYLDNSEIISR